MFRIGKFEDYKNAVKDCDHFKVYEKDDYYVINYHLSDNTTFPDPNEDGISNEEKINRILRRDCRGIIFDKEGNLIRLPYHKFFNLNEKEETNIKNVDFSRSHVILEKLDGSMVTPLVIAGHLRWATKAGITDTSMEAEVFVSTRPQYKMFSIMCLENNCLPIFEWCSRKNRIVIDYPEDNLILTAIRYFNLPQKWKGNDISGHYEPYLTMKELARVCDIPVVRCVYDGSKPIDKFIEEDIKNQEGLEGVVIRFDDGQMIKVKSEWYCQLHKMKDDLTHEKNVIRLILEEKVDDLLPFLLEDDKKRILNFQHDFLTSLHGKIGVLYECCKLIYSEMTRKEFALFDSKSYSPLEKSIIFNCWDCDKELLKEEIEKNVISIILKNLGSQSNVDKVRSLWYELKWE